jgi:hypothetical protein
MLLVATPEPHSEGDSGSSRCPRRTGVILTEPNAKHIRARRGALVGPCLGKGQIGDFRVPFISNGLFSNGLFTESQDRKGDHTDQTRDIGGVSNHLAGLSYIVLSLEVRLHRALGMLLGSRIGSR